MIDGDPRLRSTLEHVAGAMRAARDPWWIIGSAAVALHGAVPEAIRDVDLLLSTGDATRLLPPLGISPAAGAPHPKFRSALFGRWTDPQLPVEFMAGFACRVGGSWEDVSPVTRQAFAAASGPLYAMERAELIAQLERFGRPKDQLRADALRRLTAR